MDSTEFTAMTLARSRQFNLKTSYDVADTVEMLVLAAGLSGVVILLACSRE